MIYNNAYMILMNGVSSMDLKRIEEKYKELSQVAFNLQRKHKENESKKTQTQQ